MVLRQNHTATNIIDRASISYLEKNSTVTAILLQVTPQNVTVGAGGAVIALSEVDDEYEEMLLKATSVLGALGHKKHPGGGGPAGSEPTKSATRSSSSSSESKKKRVPATRRK